LLKISVLRGPHFHSQSDWRVSSEPGHCTSAIATPTCVCKGQDGLTQPPSVQLLGFGPGQQGVSAGTQDKRQAFTELVLSHQKLNKRHRIHPPWT